MRIKRHWFQFHLLTALVAMIAAGAILGLNIGGKSEYRTVVIDWDKLVPPGRDYSRNELEIRIYLLSHYEECQSALSSGELLPNDSWQPLPRGQTTMTRGALTMANEPRAQAWVARGPVAALDALQKLIVYFNVPEPPPVKQRYRNLGWPFAIQKLSVENSFTVLKFDCAAACADIGIALAIFVSVCIQCEWFIRRRTRYLHSMRLTHASAGSA